MYVHTCVCVYLRIFIHMCMYTSVYTHAKYILQVQKKFIIFEGELKFYKNRPPRHFRRRGQRRKFQIENIKRFGLYGKKYVTFVWNIFRIVCVFPRIMSYFFYQIKANNFLIYLYFGSIMESLSLPIIFCYLVGKWIK